MNKKGMATWMVAAGLGVALALGLIAQAGAQYPPVGGSVTATVDDATPGVGEEVTVTATVVDEAGVPAAGVDCTFSIGDQPGDDATVDPGPETTDAAGNVTTRVDTGSTTGTIVVDVSCGEYSAQVSIAVSAEEPAATPTSLAEEPAAPPASLPSTGGGGLGVTVWALIGAGLVVGFGGLAIAWRRLNA